MCFKCIFLIIIFCFSPAIEAASQEASLWLKACIMSRALIHAGCTVASKAKKIASASSGWVWHHKKLLTFGGMHGMVCGYVRSKFFDADVVNNQAVGTGMTQPEQTQGDGIDESILRTGLYAFQSTVYVFAGVVECGCMISNTYKKTVMLKRCKEKNLMAHFGGANRVAELFDRQQQYEKNGSAPRGNSKD